MAVMNCKNPNCVCTPHFPEEDAKGMNCCWKCTSNQERDGERAWNAERVANARPPSVVRPCKAGCEVEVRLDPGQPETGYCADWHREMRANRLMHTLGRRRADREIAVLKVRAKDVKRDLTDIRDLDCDKHGCEKPVRFMTQDDYPDYYCLSHAREAVRPRMVREIELRHGVKY